jgi:hypothetical protein
MSIIEQAIQAENEVLEAIYSHNEKMESLGYIRINYFIDQESNDYIVWVHPEYAELANQHKNINGIDWDAIFHRLGLKEFPKGIVFQYH